MTALDTIPVDARSTAMSPRSMCRSSMPSAPGIVADTPYRVVDGALVEVDR